MKRKNANMVQFALSSFFATGFPPVRVKMPLSPARMTMPLGAPGLRLKRGLIQ